MNSKGTAAANLAFAGLITNRSTIYERQFVRKSTVSAAILSGWLLSVFSFFPAKCPAQADTNVATNQETRATPAPWRPSFGTINTGSNMPPNGEAELDSLSNGGRSEPPRPGQIPTAPPASPVPAVGNAPAGTANAIAQVPVTQSSALPSADVQRNPGANLPPESGPGVTRVTHRLDQLPNSAGQVWREYDISPYTSKITTSENPQQAILDWVLRKTGTEMWFNQPLGILHANPNQLYVYHTPEIQSAVKSIVDRFVRTRGQLQRIDVSLMTIENPNWRSEYYTLLQPIEVRSPGVEAWMISKENAALLQSNISRRADFRLQNSGTLTIHDGQSFVIEKTKPVQFVKNLRWIPNQIPNYQPLMTNINEGYSLAISCLTGSDNRTIEATIKCDVDQVEKLTNVKVNVPGANGIGQQMNLQIPQLVSWRLHERFRWPDDQVLLLSCGVVANPEPQTQRQIPILGLQTTPKRADALLFIEYRGPATEATIPRSANSDLAPIRPR